MSYGYSTLFNNAPSLPMPYSYGAGTSGGGFSQMPQQGSPFGYGSQPGRMVAMGGEGEQNPWGALMQGGLGAGLAFLGDSVVPGIGQALGGAIGNVLGDTLMNHFEEEPEDPPLPLPQPDSGYLQPRMPYQAPPLPVNLSAQYGVQNPYGFR